MHSDWFAHRHFIAAVQQQALTREEIVKRPASSPFQNITSIVLVVAVSTSLTSAAIHTIEPDDYADGTALNNVSSVVELAIHSNLDNFPDNFGEFPTPSIIPVTALENEDIFGGYFTSTGVNSFGHAGIDFNSSSRAIGMRFLEPTTAVRIDAIGSSNIRDTVGVLDVFDANGEFLESVETALLGRQEVGTLSISRDQGDIGFARAYASDDHSPFGRFDNLQFTTVPEPSSLAMLCSALLLVSLRKLRANSALAIADSR